MQSSVFEVVFALNRAGFSSPAALGIVAQAWRGFLPEPATHCSQIAQRARDMFKELLDGKLLQTDDEATVERIIDQWPWPMHALEMTEKKVDPADLQKKKAAAPY